MPYKFKNRYFPKSPSIQSEKGKNPFCLDRKKTLKNVIMKKKNKTLSTPLILLNYITVTPLVFIVVNLAIALNLSFLLVKHIPIYKL